MMEAEEARVDRINQQTEYRLPLAQVLTVREEKNQPLIT